MKNLNNYNILEIFQGWEFGLMALVLFKSWQLWPRVQVQVRTSQYKP